MHQMMGRARHMGGVGMRGMRGGMRAMFMSVPWMVIMHADELGLSDQQVETLRKKHAEAKKQMIQMGCQIRMDMVDVRDAVMREEIDVKTAQAKARDIGKLKGETYATMIQAMHEMREVLSHEQRMKVRDMIMSWFRQGGMSEMGMEEGEEAEEEMEEE